MFSDRTHWQNQPNRLSEIVQSLRRNGKSIIDLTSSTPTECNIPYPQEEILRALASPEILHYYPDPHGLLSARETVSRYYKGKNLSVDPSRIFMQASTSEAYSTLFKILCNPGESVLIPKPSYPLFEYLAELNDVRLIYYPLRYDGEWHVDLAALKNAVDNSVRAITIINPHNPTGSFLKKNELAAMNALAAEHGLALVVDEVFIDYGFSEDPTRVGSTAANDAVLTFTLNGISKMLGLPQMKAGWIAVSGPQAPVKEACSRLEMVCDTFLSVNTPVQVALSSLLPSCASVRDAIKSRTWNNYQFLQNAFPKPSSCSVLPSEGGWYGLIAVPRVKSDEQWCIDLLEQQGVLVQPGYFFDFEEEGILVVSLLTEEKKFKAGVELLKEGVETAQPFQAPAKK